MGHAPSERVHFPCRGQESLQEEWRRRTTFWQWDDGTIVLPLQSPFLRPGKAAQHACLPCGRLIRSSAQQRRNSHTGPRLPIDDRRFPHDGRDSQRFITIEMWEIGNGVKIDMDRFDPRCCPSRRGPLHSKAYPREMFRCEASLFASIVSGLSIRRQIAKRRTKDILSFASAYALEYGLTLMTPVLCFSVLLLPIALLFLPVNYDAFRRLPSFWMIPSPLGLRNRLTNTVLQQLGSSGSCRWTAWVWRWLRCAATTRCESRLCLFFVASRRHLVGWLSGSSSGIEPSPRCSKLSEDGR